MVGQRSASSSSRARSVSGSMYLAWVSFTAASSRPGVVCVALTACSTCSQLGQAATIASTSRLDRSRSRSRSYRAAIATDPTPTLNPRDRGGRQSWPSPPQGAAPHQGRSCHRGRRRTRRRGDPVRVGPPSRSPHPCVRPGAIAAMCTRHPRVGRPASPTASMRSASTCVIRRGPPQSCWGRRRPCWGVAVTVGSGHRAVQYRTAHAHIGPYRVTPTPTCRWRRRGGRPGASPPSRPGTARCSGPRRRRTRRGGPGRARWCARSAPSWRRPP
jgi:hypothetical protein